MSMIRRSARPITAGLAAVALAFGAAACEDENGLGVDDDVEQEVEDVGEELQTEFDEMTDDETE